MKFPLATRLCLAGAFLSLVALRAIASPPPNDNFASAQDLSGDSGSVAAVATDATVETGEPTHLGYPPSHSIWYRIVPQISGMMIFRQQNPVNGRWIGIYRGTALGNLTEITPAPSDGNYDRYILAVEAGTTYYISFNNPVEGATFAIQLSWDVVLQPANDFFDGAQPISGESGSVTATNEVFSTVESGEPHAEDGNSLWYVWTAPRDGSFRFDVTAYVTSYHIYTGQSISSLTEIFDAPIYGHNLSLYSGIRVVQGQQYYIQVSGTGTAGSFGSPGGDFTLNWAPGPLNDDFANAIAIFGSDGSIAGNTRGGTEEPGEPPISGYAGTESIWYRWTAPETGWYSFSYAPLTSQYLFDNPLLAAYTGSAVDQLTQVASAAGATITFHADGGTAYSITIAVVPSYGNIAPRDVTLSWQKGTSPADATLLNLSTRAQVGLDSDALIGGFIITGNAAKKLIVRAIGPSMQSGGTPVEGRLVDPTLELHDSNGAAIFSNDNWIDSPQKQAIIDSTIPPSDDQESAIVATLVPGAYTAVVRGGNGGTGIALMEIYDLDVTSDSRLANVSTRGHVDTDANVMIGGVIVGDSLPTKVAVRALGPSLANANPPISDAMSNPSVELRDTSDSPYSVALNFDWYDPQVTAAGLAPSDAKEAALITMLKPGNYTAIVKGEYNTTGVGLIEIYNLE